MKPKSLAILALLGTLITSTPCVGAKDNPITSMITHNLTRARDWTSGFITRCWNVGILATLYTTIGIYDLKKISGFDETTLKTCNDMAQLESAKKRVETMIQYGPTSEKLNEFYSKIQGRIIQIQHKEED